MNLTRDHLEPFRITYANVTRRMRNRAAVVPYGNRWLRALTKGFLREFRKWPSVYPGFPKDVRLIAYIDQLYFRSGKLQWLAGSAYLHVCFDLPRVIADLLPASSKLRNDAEDLFFSLAPEFRESFVDVACDPRVVGTRVSITGKGIRKYSPDSLQLTASWVLYLRTAAWSHARRLADVDQQFERPHLEANMIRSMEAALVRASTLLKLGKMEPPTLRPFPLAAPLLVSLDPWVIAGAAALAGIFGTWFYWRKYEKLKQEIANRKAKEEAAAVARESQRAHFRLLRVDQPPAEGAQNPEDLDAVLFVRGMSNTLNGLIQRRRNPQPFEDQLDELEELRRASLLLPSPSQIPVELRFINALGVLAARYLHAAMDFSEDSVSFEDYLRSRPEDELTRLNL